MIRILQALFLTIVIYARVFESQGKENCIHLFLVKNQVMSHVSTIHKE